MKSNLEKTLEQLSAPYKKSEQYIQQTKYKRSGGATSTKSSVFWDSEAGYVPKYKNVSSKRTNQEEKQEQSLGR